MVCLARGAPLQWRRHLIAQPVLLVRNEEMRATDPERNRLYARAEDLHPLHWEQLARRAPEEAARAAGASWDGRVYTLPLLGKVLRVEPETRSVRTADLPAQSVGFQRALAAVAYLAGALEVPPRGDWVAFRELPGGDGFFRGPHSVATARLEEAYGGDPRALVGAAEPLGWTKVEGADAAVEMSALPKIPLRVLLWGRTEEFGASAALLTDGRAHLHLALDVLWALSNVAISELVKTKG
jgi:hypothetical protein